MAWQPKGNIKGPKGDTGSTGNTGAQGPPGNTGAQGPQGVKGDTGNTGAQGAQGTPGTPGTPGELWFTGAGAPASGVGAVGDWFLRSDTGDYYEKTAAAIWTLRGNLKGATGSQGIQGPQGNTGSQGPAGAGVPLGGAIGAILRKKSATDNDTEWKSFASAQVQAVANPPGVVTTVGKMAGFGTATYGAFLFTPTASGKALVIISFALLGDTASMVLSAGMRYGTGTAPVNGAATAGTATGGAFVRQGAWGVNQGGAVTLTTVITGLVAGTQYWFDLVLAAGAASQTVQAQSGYFSAVELP